MATLEGRFLPSVGSEPETPRSRQEKNINIPAIADRRRASLHFMMLFVRSNYQTGPLNDMRNIETHSSVLIPKYVLLGIIRQTIIHGSRKTQVDQFNNKCQPVER